MSGCDGQGFLSEWMGRAFWVSGWAGLSRSSTHPDRVDGQGFLSEWMGRVSEWAGLSRRLRREEVDACVGSAPFTDGGTVHSMYGQCKQNSQVQSIYVNPA